MNQLASKMKFLRQPGLAKAELEGWKKHLEPLPTLVLSSLPTTFSPASNLSAPALHVPPCLSSASLHRCLLSVRHAAPLKRRLRE